MAWTIGEMVSMARDQLQDSREPYRHSDVKLVRYLNLGLTEVRRLRPDLLLPDVTDLSNDYTTADMATAIPTTAMSASALLDFVTGTVSLEEDEFVQDSRGVGLLNRFTQKLVGKGA